MYHIYLNEEAVDAFALRLVSAKPFRDGTYTLYADVPVKCLGYEAPYFTTRQNLSTMDEHTATQTVDFIVTKGTDVMLGITTEVMAGKSRKLFDTVLQALPHLEVTDGGLPRKYRNLYHRVRDRLEIEEDASHCFSLRPFPVELSQQELKSKCLLNPNGNVSPYGRAHGLFFRYAAGADGSLERHPVSSTVTFRDYLRSANWGGQGGDFEELQALLDTSMGELFRHHSEEWNRLSDIMTELSGLQSYPAFAPDNILEDYPELVYRLRCRVADDNPENSRIMKLTGELLECIGQVLGDERTAQRFAVLRMPLYGYFQEAALRSGLYYPQWLFDHAVRPFLNETRFCGAHTLQTLLRCRSALPKHTSFPDLMELLVLPLCTPDLAV